MIYTKVSSEAGHVVLFCFFAFVFNFLLLMMMMMGLLEVCCFYFVIW